MALWLIKRWVIACCEITQSTWLCLIVKILKLPLPWLILPEGKPCSHFNKKKDSTCKTYMLIFSGPSRSSLTTLSGVIHRLVKSTIAAKNGSFFPNKRKWQQLQRSSHLKTSLLTSFHPPTIGGDAFKRLFIFLGFLHLQCGPLQDRRDTGDVSRLCSLVTLLAGSVQRATTRRLHL